MRLVIEKLSKTYPGGVRALDEVSLEIPRGMFGLLGPNGAGKSTLLKVISRSLSSQGQLRFEGHSLHDYSTEHVVGLGICH